MILFKNIKAQSTVEFTYAMIVIMFLVYGMVQIFRWAGMDLAQRRYLQDKSLVTLKSGADVNSEFLNMDFDQTLPLDAVYHGKITSGNTSRP